MAWYNLGSWFGNGNGGDTIKEGQQKTYPMVPTEVKDFDTAMTQSAFWASVRLLTETVSAMPIIPYSVDLESGIKERDYNNELWDLINYNPNSFQTKIEFFEQIMLNLTCWGNAYVIIEKTASGRIVSLTPYPSSQIKTFLQDNEVIHQYTTPEGNIKIFSSETVWHIKLFGNGIVGLSPLQYAGNVLGISKNLGDRQAKLAANGGKTNGILTVDQALKPEQKEAVRKSFAGLQEGNADELFVLEAGFNYQQASLSPTDMQLLESRRFSVEEIARFMGVPSVLINDTASSTTWGSGIEQINTGFYKLNLRPYLERIEASLKKKLMNPNEWRTTDIEFNFDSLLRADSSTRAEANSKRINSAQATPNEVRASEGLPPMEGGDKIYLNGSLVPAGTNPNEQTVNENEQ
jgi:HK97 family phage portal protein